MASNPDEWVVLLTPHAAEPAFSLPGDALQVYAAHWWDEAPPGPDELTYGLAPRWRSVRDGVAEVAHAVVATRHGTAVAGALHVSRCRWDGEAQFGERALPVLAPIGDEVSRERLAVPRGDVAAFAGASGATHDLHCDVDAARRAGYGDVLVQGLLLTMRVARAAEVRVGRIETWYRRPLEAGTTVDLVRHVAGMWTVDGGDGPIAVARVTA